MRISVTDARDHLTDLVRRAEAGDEVILTDDGHAVVRLVPITPARDMQSRWAVLDRVRTSSRAKARSGPDAARSQDFLYGPDGLPE